MTKINLQVQYFAHKGFIFAIEDEPDGLREVYMRKNGC